MTQQAYNTGTIELMPYAEHGEFCIVGVFAVDTQHRKLHFRLQESIKTKRLTGFFPELERKLFTKTLSSLHEEWKELCEKINKGADTQSLDLQTSNGKEIYAALTHPREGMVRQTPRGTILTKDIEQWLEQAFLRMVLRVDQQHTPPQEQRLTKKITGLLKTWKLSRAWKERRVGRDDYHTIFPFTYQPKDSDKVQRAIKPLFLGHDSATKILDHGDAWLQKVRRLKHFNLAPEIIVFPVQRPDQDDSQRADHAELVINDLLKEGAKIVEHGNLNALREFVEVGATMDAPLFERKA
jgi:hypothetical protein